MAQEIRTAAERMERRKVAADIGGDSSVGEMVDQDRARLIFSGVGLDFDEIMELTPGVEMAVLQGLIAGLPPTSISAGLYFDGIVTGLLIAEAREREASAA